MNTGLMNNRLTPSPKTGTEQFHTGDSPIGATLHSFWQWNSSDLVSNTTRGRLAEFIVARGLGIDTSEPREEWQAYDLLWKEKIKIEVKVRSVRTELAPEEFIEDNVQGLQDKSMGSGNK
jgi:hypothetical protein